MNLSDIIQTIFIVFFITYLIWIARKDWYAYLILCFPLWIARKLMWTPNIVSWVISKIPYAHDETVYDEAEHWATLEEFWQHKMGDCEDYAGFAIGILKDYGYQGDIYTYIPNPNNNIGHALGIVSKDLKNWYVFDLADVTQVRAKSWQTAGDWYVRNIPRVI